MFKKIPFNILKLFFVTIGSLVILGLSIDALFQHKLLPDLKSSTNIGKIRRLVHEQHPGEIAVFGSSIARRSYIPDTVGLEMFNYGMAGMLYNSIHCLMTIEMEKDKKAPVILDFDHHTFFYDPALRLHTSTYLPEIENDHIEKLLMDYGYYSWHFHVPGMRYYGSYLDYIRQALKPLIEKEEQTNKGGVFFPVKPKVYQQFRRKRLEMQDKFNALEMKKDYSPNLFTREERYEFNWLDALLNFHVDSAQLRSFEDLARAHPHRLIIMAYSPQNIIKLDGLKNREECQLFLKELSARHKNIFVMDYSEIGFPELYYKDSGHMNIQGAQEYSALLRRDLPMVIGNDSILSLNYVEIRE